MVLYQVHRRSDIGKDDIFIVSTGLRNISVHRKKARAEAKAKMLNKKRRSK